MGFEHAAILDVGFGRVVYDDTVSFCWYEFSTCLFNCFLVRRGSNCRVCMFNLRLLIKTSVDWNMILKMNVGRVAG